MPGTFRVLFLCFHAGHAEAFGAFFVHVAGAESLYERIAVALIRKLVRVSSGNDFFEVDEGAEVGVGVVEHMEACER